MKLSHFWTTLVRPEIQSEIRSGTRCSLQISQAGDVHVVHRQHAILGLLPEELAAEIIASGADKHYLGLIDSITPPYSLLVIRALAEVPAPAVVEYAANAFIAPRNKC